MYLFVSWGRPRQKLAERNEQKEKKATEEKDKKAENVMVPVGVDPSLVQTLPYDPEVAATEIASSVDTLESPVKRVLETENSWWKCQQYLEEMKMKRFKEQPEAPAPDSQTHDTDDTDETLAKSLQEASLTPIVDPEISQQPQLSAASTSDEPKESKLEDTSQSLAPGVQSKLDAGAEAFKDVPNTQAEGEQKVSGGDEKEGGEVLEVKESGDTQDLTDPMGQSLDSVPKPEDDVEIIEPAVSHAPESSKPVDHSVGLLEDMLKQGLDLAAAIGHLKNGTWPCPKADDSKADGAKKADGSKAPVVSRIEQFKNKSGQPTEVVVPDGGVDESGSKPPAPKEAETKREGKGKGKGKGKGNTIKPKAKAKSLPKGKAKAKAKSSPKGKAKAKAKTAKGKAEDVEEDTEDLETKDDETMDVETQEHEKNEEGKGEKKVESDESEKKPQPTKNKKEPNEEAPAKKPKKDAKSFARRPCPSTSPAKDKWIAISQTFKSQVQQQILEAGEKVSKWEEREKGVSGRCWQRVFFHLILEITYAWFML